MFRICYSEVAFMDAAIQAARLPHAKNWESLGTKQTPSTLIRSLSLAPLGSGHDKFLSGICVFVVIEAGHHFWLQFAEYHFRWAVSSTSKMHTYANMTEKEIEALPIGTPLTQAHVLNYRQLKTMYSQRKHHRLQSWQLFCAWIKTLPNSFLITGEENETIPS